MEDDNQSWLGTWRCTTDGGLLGSIWKISMKNEELNTVAAKHSGDGFVVEHTPVLSGDDLVFHDDDGSKHTFSLLPDGKMKETISGGETGQSAGAAELQYDRVTSDPPAASEDDP